MVERLYRLVLRLLPREFRRRFGAELIDTARALDRDGLSSSRHRVRAFADALFMPLRLRADLRDEARGAAPARRTLMPAFFRDVRFAIRSLRRDPAFTLFVTVTLALGIGANAAMFGIADRLLISGPAYVRDARRVVRVYATTLPPGMRTFTTDGFGYVTYDVLRRDSPVFDGFATYAIGDVVVGRSPDSAPARAGFATAGLFPLLGVEPAVGRFFTESEDAPASPEPVVVLSDSTWNGWYGRRADVLGRTVVVNDEAYTVIGVAPPGFTGPQLGRVDLWMPGSIQGRRMTQDWTRSWNSQWLKIVGRLKPGITFEQAGAAATTVWRRGYTGGDPTDAQARFTVASLSADSRGAESTELRVLRWLTAVAGLVLLIACANVVNLLLARGVKRSREVAIRSALGASRFRVVRLLLFESLVLAIGGALAGVAVAYGVGGLARSALFTAVEWPNSPVNARVLLMSAALAIATGLLIGVLPAIRSTRAGVADALKTGARDGRGRRSRLRGALTVVQATVSVVLLVGAGLFVKSLWMARSVDLGIDTRVMVFDVNRRSLAAYAEGPAREAERQRRRTFLGTTVDQVLALPGVERAAVAVGLPFGNRFTIQVRRSGGEAMPTLSTGGPGISAVGPAYFDTVGTRIVRGRAFGPGDHAGTEPVAIVSDFMARTVWPDRDPLGQCLLVGPDAAACTRVIGVAGDTHRGRLREDPSMHYYIPLGQELTLGFGGAVLVVRAADGDAPPVDAVRRLVRDMDGSITYVTAETVQDRIDPQLRPWRLGATVFLLSGLLALVVAAVGIYSVMSYLIADRRQEIGVRLALGATAGQIVALVLRGSLVLAAVGIATGEGIALLLGRFADPLLFDTSSHDPIVFGGVAGVLIAVATAATLAPARRARGIDPVEALRVE